MSSSSLCSTEENNNNNEHVDSSTTIEQEKNKAEESSHWPELTLVERHSLLSTLNRICVHWYRIIFNRIRWILTVTIVTMINLVTRLTHFSSPPQTTSSSIQTLENDIHSILLTDPSTDSTEMANMLVQHQQMPSPPSSPHRSPSIRIHSNKATSNEHHLPTVHSVDERIFLKDNSACFLNLFQHFTSDHFYSSSLPVSNSFLYSPPSSLISDRCLPTTNTHATEPVNEQIDFNGDLIQSIDVEDGINEKLDAIVSTDSTPLKTEKFEGDILLPSHSPLTTERYFRRRKRRSSLTRSPDDDITQTLDINNNNSADQSKEISPLSLIESLSINDNQEEKKELSESTTPVSRYRARRLRHRFYRRASSDNASNPVEFYVPNETVSSPATFTPPPSPPLPPASPLLPSPTRNTGSLKRTGSLGTHKKIVRFADSIGRELAQVQYIQPFIEDDCKDVLYQNKKNLHSPKSSEVELKPWGFDFALNSRQSSFDHPKPKRFFCLYRQPNSEHPDIYLHDVWRSQIKLEHADIRVKNGSTTGEQHLYGTCWVTNASYWKYVTVKYTFNQWMNTYEYEARHRCHSNDFRNLDQFEFSIDIPHDVDRIDFILRYCVNGQEHWDNNDGKNYTLQSETSSTPQTTISLPHDCDFNEMRFY